MLASRSAGRCANKDIIVRTKVVIPVSFQNVRHHLITTFWIHAVVGAYIEKKTSIRL